MITILLFAGIGSLIFMFCGWLSFPANPPSTPVHVRVAVGKNLVLVGVKAGEKTQFFKIER